MKLNYDLHLHSCLSPCGDDTATPAMIAGMAKLAGADVAALSDHNTTGNCPAFMRAAEEYGLLAIPAMELTTQEEVHVLCLFPELKAASEFDRYVYERIPDIKNRSDIFGNQFFMDENDRVTGEEGKLLINASTIGVYEVASIVESFDGVAIPAHIDRKSFSLLASLGVVDPTLGFGIFELADPMNAIKIAEKHPELLGKPFVCNSDAHRLEDIPDAAYSLEAEEATVKAVIKALRAGRKFMKI